MKQCTNERGFTLIEVLIAMSVLTVGILSLYALQISSVKGNTFAFGQTVAATLGMNQIELILASPYDQATALNNTIDDDHNGVADDASDFLLNDTNANGMPGINNTVDAAGNITSDYNMPVQDEQGLDFDIYWNVAEDNPIVGVKTVRVIVTRTDMGARRSVALTYYKHNTF